MVIKYPDAFQAYQPLELGRWFINHAHNDYLEWLFEAGLPAALILALLLVLYLHQWGKVWTREEWSRFRFVQVGAGIGIFLLLLHGLVDYNLRIPANIVYFAFLVGIFFRRPEQEPATGRRRGARRTADLAPHQPAGGPEPAVELKPEDLKNPFLD